MKRKQEADLLTVYTDHLLGLSRQEAGGLPASTRHEQVHSLLTLADHLHAILAPVEPEPHFRRRLHGELILTAQGRREMPEVGLLQQHRRGLVIGAALGLGSVASVIGVVIAVLLRRRAGNVAAG
ncbi:MAG TPA: hypothetical protein VLC95_11010 [Anaerolineae bacterium]|nr:hypothetical protein [Anaerolineae bacterium]